MAGWVLSVDFGSSNTAAAYRDPDGRTHEVRLSATGSLMPSAVLYGPERILVGRTAVQAAHTLPDAFEPSPKRRLPDREVLLGDAVVPVIELVAAVLSEVLARARRVMGSDPDRVILTHPDKWSPGLQQQLADAAVRAGLDAGHVTLVSEATAAARFYSTTQHGTAARLAVFDFGAGTCDVAVLDRQPDGSFAVLAADGVEGLGGQDLDARIMSWVRRQLAADAPLLAAELDDPAAIGTRLNVLDRVRDAKEALSEAMSASIVVSGGAGTKVLQLTRDEFEQLIRPDIDRAVALTADVLARAGSVHALAEAPVIYLTGGSSSIPLIHSRLADLGVIAELGDPKTVVCQGALHTYDAPAAPPPAPPPPPPPPVRSATPPAPPPPVRRDAPPAVRTLAAAQHPPPTPPRPAPPPVSAPPRPAPPAPAASTPVLRRPNVLVPAIAGVVVLVAAVVFAVGQMGGDSEGVPTSAARSNSSAPAAAAPPTSLPGPTFDGTFQAAFGPPTDALGDPMDGAARTETWAVRSWCATEGCVATASAVGAAAFAPTLVFDFVDGRWLAVSELTVNDCDNQPNQRWEVVSLEPRPDGTLTGGQRTYWPRPDCGSRGGDVTFTRTGDVPDGAAVSDPADVPPREISPGQALSGSYRYVETMAGGRQNTYDFTTQTNCLRTTGRCMTRFDSVDSAVYWVFADGVWKDDEFVKDTCSDGSPRETNYVATYPMPQPPQNPIALLSGQGRMIGTGSCARTDDYTATLTRTGD